MGKIQEYKFKGNVKITISENETRIWVCDENGCKFRFKVFGNTKKVNDMDFVVNSLIVKPKKVETDEESRKYKVGDKIKVRVKSNNNLPVSLSLFSVGKEYDAVLHSIDGEKTISSFNIVSIGARCFKKGCAHLGGGNWEILE